MTTESYIVEFTAEHFSFESSTTDIVAEEERITNIARQHYDREVSAEEADAVITIYAADTEEFIRTYAVTF